VLLSASERVLSSFPFLACVLLLEILILILHAAD
jgi:hypothetical protein